MLLFLKKLSKTLILLCITHSSFAPAFALEPGAMFYRQHTQGQCLVINDGDTCPDEEPEEEPEFTKADYGLLSFSYHSPRGIGYKTGYYSLAFSNVIKVGSFGFFSAADWRFHYMANGRLAMNLGVGGRYIDPSLTHSLGTFVYYDYRTTHLKNYHQVSVGAEWLTTCFDVRLNGYYPIGAAKSRTSHHLRKKSKSARRMRNTYNYSYAHLDVEIGKMFEATEAVGFYFGAQGYYLKAREEAHKNKEVFGTKLRLVASAKNRASVEVIGSYDPIFKARFQFTCFVPLSYETSLISALSGLCVPDLLCKIGGLPVRNEIIILKSKHYWSRH